MQKTGDGRLHQTNKAVSGSPTKRGPLPFMKSIKDAERLVEKEHDPFYLDAFMIEAWLGTVAWQAATEYGENKNAKDRSMQTGQAWRGFLDLFGHAKVDEFHCVMQSLYRFCEYDDAQAEMLLRAFTPLSFEHECFSDLVGAKTIGKAQRPAEALPLLKRCMERWCDWLDAVCHFDTHFHYHVLRESFDPDPEKRELAALGVVQRNFPDLKPFSRDWWEWHHREAAERIKDLPKWQTIGKLAVAPLRSGPANVDEVLIILWPLVKRHNWTYRDLMAVVRRGLPTPDRYPLEREQDLAAYCSNVLGLRKQNQSPGRSSPEGKPRGWEVAKKMCAKAAESS